MRQWLSKAIKEMEKPVSSLEIIHVRLQEITHQSLGEHIQGSEKSQKRRRCLGGNLGLLFICRYLVGYDWARVHAGKAGGLTMTMRLQVGYPVIRLLPA